MLPRLGYKRLQPLSWKGPCGAELKLPANSHMSLEGDGHLQSNLQRLQHQQYDYSLMRNSVPELSSRDTQDS